MTVSLPGGAKVGSFLSDKKINTGRQSEVDMVKAFAIPFMICIHIYEQFGGYDFADTAPDTLFRNVMEFIGGPLAAPVFMFSMGIGIKYTRHDLWREFVKRGGKLLMTGLMLNFFRQTLPQLIGLLLGIDSGLDIIGGLLCVDILPFAGMAFITVGVMRRLKLSEWQICGASFLMQAVGIWSTRLDMAPGVVQNLLGLLIPTGKWTSFPLTLWLVYPSLGMVFGDILTKCTDKDKMYRMLMICSAVFFSAFTVGLVYSGYDIRNIYALCGDSYYHHSIIATLWITPIIIFALGTCYFICGKADNTKIGSFIRYCSVNLNTVYIIQWLIISYSAALFILFGINRSCSPLILLSGGVMVTAVSVLVSVPVARIKMRKD